MATKTATSYSKCCLNRELWALCSKMCPGLTDKGKDLVSFIEEGYPDWCEVESYQLVHFNRDAGRYLPSSKVFVKSFEVDKQWYEWRSTMRSSSKDHYFDCLMLSRTWYLLHSNDERWTDDEGTHWCTKSLPKFGFATEPTVIRIWFKSGSRGAIEINCPENVLSTLPKRETSGRAGSIGLGYPSPHVETGIEF